MDETYTGEVVPHGVPHIRRLPGLIITKYAVDPQTSNNCYLLECTSTGLRALVDAAAEGPSLIQLCDAQLTSVVTTHQHWDHHRALAEVVAATGAESIAGEPDADAIASATGVPVSRRVADGDSLTVGDVTLSVIAVAGHTPGSICLLYDDPSGHPHLFTGDSLFPGGVGNTQGDPERFAQLIGDVETKLFGTLPDETWFYPGHGNDSTLGAERASIPEWRERGW